MCVCVCVSGGSGDSVKILRLNVTPDPPEKGQKVMVDMKLQFSELHSLHILTPTHKSASLISRKYHSIIFQ